MRRSYSLLAVSLVKHVKSPASVDDNEKSHDTKPETEQISTYIPTPSEAPELLQAYVEPKPFISAKRLQVFAASLCIGASTIGVIYYLLSRSLSDRYDEERRHVQRVVESNRLAMIGRESVLPDFAAPSSFVELKDRMQQYERELERQQAQIDQRTIMLHTELVFRVKVWWNASLTHVQEALERFGTAHKRRKERAAMTHIEEALRDQGYELVKLRSGNTHIWS